MERPIEGFSCRSQSDLKGHFKSPKCKIFDQPDVKDTIHKLHANYVLVLADKAANNVIVVCKKYTCLSILLATLNYRARATFGPSTLNYSLNGAANVWQMEFSSPPSLNISGRRMKFIIMQLIEISTL